MKARVVFSTCTTVYASCFLVCLYLEQVLREDEETFVVLFLGVVMDSFFNDAGRAIFLFYASGFVDHCDTRLFGKWMDER